MLGFLLISLLATWGAFSKDQLGCLANLLPLGFLPTFAALACAPTSCELKKQGFRPFVMGAIGEVAIAIVTLGLVLAVPKCFS